MGREFQVSANSALLTSPLAPRPDALDLVRGRDLSGRTAIVTGASSGIGVETARTLALAGAEVVLAVRDATAGQEVADALNREAGTPRATVQALELASLASVRDFARRWAGRPLHLLINNAGIMACPHGTTEDGFETQFGVNHLGHFLLSVLLAPALVKGAEGAKITSRVVSVSSGGHLIDGVDFDDPHFRHRTYGEWRAYGQSKTANILFAVGFDRRFKAQGVRANAIAPGMIKTRLSRHLTPATWKEIGINPPPEAYKTPQQGASTTIWAAVGPELEGVGALYLEDCQQAPLCDPSQKFACVAPYALDPALAERLWDLSARETGAPA
jgi:NAD(P)-dependent dehydrogenase (short-subunit alcohol dehydrogenase family)